MKIFKRLVLCVLVVAVMLSAFAPTAVFAAGSTYHIDEMKLSVTIPSKYSVITRDTPSDAAIFSELGISKSSLMSQFQANSIYLNAISDTYTEEVVVTSAENIINNFCLLSDTELNTLASTFVNEFANTLGVTVSKYDIYQHSQAKFVRLYWYDAANYAYGLQYYTIYDNTAMNFTMRSYNGKISAEQERTIKAIVDSVNYDNEPPTVDEGANTEPFVYTDSDSGVKFTVPANWVEDEFNEEREFLDAKFTSTKEQGLIMLFSSTDAWSEASPADRLGMSRSDIDNSMFSKADIAQIGSTTEDNVSTVTYNGVEYYKCESTVPKELYGLEFDVDMTQLIYIDNGWMYIFQFGGTSDHKLYADFESLIRSVEYPADINSEVAFDDGISYKTDTNDSYNGYSDDNSGVIIAVVILIVAAVIVAVVLFVRKKNYKTTYETINNNADYTSHVVYCRKCGQRLPLDSEFCHICGTKIDKGV